MVLSRPRVAKIKTWLSLAKKTPFPPAEIRPQIDEISARPRAWMTFCPVITPATMTTTTTRASYRSWTRAVSPTLRSRCVWSHTQKTFPTCRPIWTRAFKSYELILTETMPVTMSRLFQRTRKNTKIWKKLFKTLSPSSPRQIKTYIWMKSTWLISISAQIKLGCPKFFTFSKFEVSYGQPVRSDIWIRWWYFQNWARSTAATAGSKNWAKTIQNPDGTAHDQGSV